MTTDREPDSEPGKSDAGHFFVIVMSLLACVRVFPVGTLGNGRECDRRTLNIYGPAQSHGTETNVGVWTPIDRV